MKDEKQNVLQKPVNGLRFSIKTRILSGFSDREQSIVYTHDTVITKVNLIPLIFCHFYHKSLLFRLI